MPLTYNGKTLNNKDIQALKSMLRSSLENLENYFQHGYLEDDDDQELTYSSKLLSNVFSKALKNLDSRIDNASKSRSAVNATDLISGIYSDISKDAIRVSEDKKLSFFERKRVNIEIADFGTEEIFHYLNYDIRPRNTDAGYSKSESGFHLATKPIEGIDEIAGYDPNTTRIQVLYEPRSANSNTLTNKVGDAEKQLEQVPKEDTGKQKKLQEKLDAARTSITGFHAVGEMSRIHSVDLMSKKEVSFGDLYNVISDLNKQARIGDPEGGTIRAESVSAGFIVGASSCIIPKSLFKTLSTIADTMNQIKKTENEALRKTQALQLASFAYNMILSEHPFNDGNGRTCRVFADTILQTFGLPPHIPQPELRKTSATMGEVMDFDKGANAILKGIRQSDKLLKEERERLKQLPGEKERLNAQVTSLENSVKKLASEAKAKLNELNSATKNGHNNGREYIDMYNALKTVSELDPSKNTVRSVEAAISRLSETSKEYERTHTGFFKGRSGFGLARKNISKDLQKIAAFRKDVVAGFAKDLDKNTVISGLHPDSMSEVNTKSVKSNKINHIDLNEVIKIEKSENPAFKDGSARNRSNAMHVKRTPVNSKTNDPVIKAPRKSTLTGP